MLTDPAAVAGPWVRDPGGVYAKASVGLFTGDYHETDTSTGTGQAVPLAYQDTSASLYGEVGLPWGLQATGYLPYVVAGNDDGLATFHSYSGGDAELGLARRVLRSPVALSVSTVAKVPLYTDRGDARTALYGPYASRFPVPGDGQVDLDARVELGASLPTGRLGAWAQGWTGYRHRLGEYVDGVPWSVQVGAAPSSRAGRALGWVGIEASGVTTPRDDPATKTWTRFGGFAAVKLRDGLAIEAWGGVIPIARVSNTGGGGGIGVSWTRSPKPASTAAARDL